MSLISGSATVARIFVEEDDRYRGNSMYEAILSLAKEMKLAGCTVLRAVEGYGASTMIHSDRAIRSSEDLPIIIELVESRDRLRRFLKRVEAMLAEARCGSLITLSDVDIVRYQPDER